ncbi:MAG: 4-hydroxy-3-methylbut-2-enyl diphosphate reductase [Candidatus Marinimicrobia bacterium]|nr:4-hydroxy-3-methylbut-2-enyl diphosphate reductase [Candidatus Neomarinimicrobiota bacterium]
MRKVRIEVAKSIGFCSGVTRAVKIAEETAARYGSVQMLGDIVHNKIVVEKLKEQHVEVVDDPQKLDRSKPLLLRAHGTILEVENQLRQQGYFLIDATCPLVKEIHREAIKLENEGRRVIIIGDHGHDEVLGIESRLKNPVVIYTADEAEKLSFEKQYGVVVQSTQSIQDVGKILEVIAQKCDDLHFVNTICGPTRMRQKQVKELALNNQLVLIVGSSSSANTLRLLRICKDINFNTIQIETEKELQKQWFETVNSVGISGGASTPEYVVDAVKKSVQKIFESLLN